MTIQVMPSGRAGLAGPRNWSADLIKAVLVTSGYTFSNAHANLSDVTAGFRVATVTLSGKSLTNGLLFASSPIVWPSVTSADPIQGFYLYYDSGEETTSTLLAWFDGIIQVTIASSTSSAVGVPIDVTPALIPNDAVLTAVSGTGPSTITLSATGGNASLVTIASTDTTTEVAVSALQSLVPGSSILTRVSGTGPDTITLAAVDGDAGATSFTANTSVSYVAGDTYMVNMRTLTSVSPVSVIAGDVYTVAQGSSGLPISDIPSATNVSYTIDPVSGLIRLAP